MLILLTGATGFIGGNLASRLCRAGYQVRALVRPTSDRKQLAGMEVEIVSGDTSDTGFLHESVRGCDIVINTAGRLGRWGDTDDDLRDVNVAMVGRLLEACQGTSVRQFIQFSTPGVVGMVGVAPECMPFHPTGLYERTKCEAEKLISNYSKQGSVPVTILRPDFVYGPGDLHKLKMFKAIAEKHFPILGKGTALLHPTYIDDVVDGTILAIDNPEAYGQTFNIAGPRPVTVRELVHTVASELGVEAANLPVPPFVLKSCALLGEIAFGMLKKQPPVTRQQIRFFTRDHASDISKAKRLLGYRPQVNLDDGVRRVIEWYRQEGYL